jgi:hypothetical protein
MVYSFPASPTQATGRELLPALQRWRRVDHGWNLTRGAIIPLLQSECKRRREAGHITVCLLSKFPPLSPDPCNRPQKCSPAAGYYASGGSLEGKSRWFPRPSAPTPCQDLGATGGGVRVLGSLVFLSQERMRGTEGRGAEAEDADRFALTLLKEAGSRRQVALGQERHFQPRPERCAWPSWPAYSLNTQEAAGPPRPSCESALEETARRSSAQGKRRSNRPADRLASPGRLLQAEQIPALRAGTYLSVAQRSRTGRPSHISAVRGSPSANCSAHRC